MLDISKYLAENDNTINIKNHNSYSLYLAVSGKCNLNCTYCFLKKDEVNTKIDLEVRNSFINGNYVENVVKAVDRLGINKFLFGNLEFWGGETTLHFDIIGPELIKLLNYFPNINKVFFSTNGTCSSKKMISFLEYIDENLNRKVTLSFQVSIDGPAEILKRTRNLDYNIVKKNLTETFQHFNTKKIKNLKIELYYKPTLPWDIFRELFSNKEGIKNYCDFFEEQKEYFDNIILNKEIHYFNSGYPNCTTPYEYTSEDGIELEKIARLFDQFDFSIYKHYAEDTNFAFSLFKEEFKIGTYSQKSFCGMNYISFLFRHDGSLLPCSQAIIDDIEDHKKIMEKENLEEFNSLNRIYLKNYFINVLKSSDKEIEEFFRKQKIIWSSQVENIRYNLVHIMEYMAEAKLISPIYIYNKETLVRHAYYLVPRVNCYYNDIKVNGSPFIPLINAIKLYANGVLEFFDLRKGEKLSQEFRVGEREEWKNLDISNI